MNAAGNAASSTSHLSWCSLAAAWASKSCSGIKEPVNWTAWRWLRALAGGLGGPRRDVDGLVLGVNAGGGWEPLMANKAVRPVHSILGHPRLGIRAYALLMALKPIDRQPKPNPSPP